MIIRTLKSTDSDIKQVNDVVITGRIIENNKNSEFMDELTCVYPFGGNPVLPLKIEVSTTENIILDDGSEDTKKYIMNVNLYNDLIDKVIDDSENFRIGSRVQIKGYFISKNYLYTQEHKNLMNFCNRYKNLHEDQKPILEKYDKPYLDKERNENIDRYYINWEALLLDGYIESIPEEDMQDKGRIEYFVLEDGRVFSQEKKSNYLLIARDIEKIEDFIDTSKGDKNFIEISGYAKDIYISPFEDYEIGHICIINKAEDMTRNSYIHVKLIGKDLSIIKNLSSNDFLNVRGKIKHKVVTKTITKTKGKKTFEINTYINVYEVLCRNLFIFKS